MAKLSQFRASYGNGASVVSPLPSRNKLDWHHWYLCYWNNQREMGRGNFICSIIRIWKSCCYIGLVERLSGSMSIFDTLCKRSRNFVRQCVNSENVSGWILFLVMRRLIAECALVWVKTCSFTANVLVRLLDFTWCSYLSWEKEAWGWQRGGLVSIHDKGAGYGSWRRVLFVGRWVC